MKNKLIEIKNLKVKFKDKTALNISDLELPTNKAIGIIGGNGSGKSTLINSILDLHNYTGELKKDFNLNDCGIQLQYNDYNTQILTKEIIYLVDLENKSRNHELYKKFGIDEFKNIKVSNLSGGQRQKLTLFLTLFKDPSVIILDEPTTGLDYSSRSELLDVISKNVKNKSLLLVSHYFEEIESVCEYLIVLFDGRLVFSGNISEFIEQYNTYNFYKIDKLDKTPKNDCIILDYNIKEYLIVSKETLKLHKVKPGIKESYLLLEFFNKGGNSD